MTATLRARAVGLVLLVPLVLAGCSDAAQEPGSGAGDVTADAAGQEAAPDAAAADGSRFAGPQRPAPPPERGCYDLDLDAALAATDDSPTRPCASPHTARTFLVGRLDRAVDGHLLAVDSDRVRSQVATQCPAALPGFVGGGEDGWRLSVLRAVWFTPTLPEADAGASWFRCDVVAPDGRGGLLPLGGRLEGTLATPAGRDRWGLCATGAPDDRDARRVACAEQHSWRAVSVVELAGTGAAGEDYPGEQAARERGQEPCEQVGRDRAADPLEFTWGYEWPSAEQWAAGQRFGRCWVPVA
ncbi:MAG: septum formation family protein [Nocardioides sp.]